MKTPCTAQADKKLKYIRYADDFIIGVKGSKEDCQWIKSKLSEFIGQTLKMELSEEKTLITHSSECARFLGFDVRVRRCEKVKRNKKGTKRELSTTMLNCECHSMTKSTTLFLKGYSDTEKGRKAISRSQKFPATADRP